MEQRRCTREGPGKVFLSYGVYFEVTPRTFVYEMFAIWSFRKYSRFGNSAVNYGAYKKRTQRVNRSNVKTLFPTLRTFRRNRYVVFYSVLITAEYVGNYVLVKAIKR